MVGSRSSNFDLMQVGLGILGHLAIEDVLELRLGRCPGILRQS